MNLLSVGNKLPYIRHIQDIMGVLCTEKMIEICVVWLQCAKVYQTKKDELATGQQCFRYFRIKMSLNHERICSFAESKCVRQQLEFVEGRFIVARSLLTVALFAVSAKFKAWMTHAAEGAQHVDTSMGTLGMA